MPENSFPSSHRLLKSDDFNAVFDQRDYSVSNKSILVLASKNALGFNRLGMIVGKVDVEEILGSIFNDFCIGK